MIAYILHEIEKRAPQNVIETKSRLLLPIYQFVTSPNFLVGIFVAVMLFVLVLLPMAFAYSQEVIDRNGIKHCSTRVESKYPHRNI
jgi:hypothetical protein